MKQHIPNTLTSLNLFSGCAGLVFAFEGKLHIAALLVLAASVLDFLDGMSARLLKAYSPMGKELDSLADLVSFGLVPSAIVFNYLTYSLPSWSIMVLGLNAVPFIAFILTIFSALRLAHFNIDEKQSEEFIGLPTPANALFFISFPLIVYYGNETSALHAFIHGLTQNSYFMIGLTLVFSFLMVSPLPLFSLKFKSLGFPDNRARYIFAVISILLLVFLTIYALPFIIITYIALSLVIHLLPVSPNHSHKT